MRAAILTLALAGCAAAPQAAPADPPTRPRAPKLGDEAPGFIADTLNPEACGIQKIDLAATPRRPVILAFAASWCEPCKKELPALIAAEAEYRKKGVLTLYIAVDEIPDLQKLPFPAIADDYQILSRRYGATALPLLILIDPYGRIAWRREGYTTTSIEALTERLHALLAAAPVDSR